MKQLLKNKYLIGLALVAVIVYFMQSYHRKTEQYKLELSNKISVLTEEKLKVSTELDKTKQESLKMAQEIAKLKKSLNVSKKKYYENGQIKEEVIISKNEESEQSKSNKEENKIETDKSKQNIEQDKKEEKKQEVIIKEEIKKEEVKKSNTNTILLMIGAGVLCFATGICAF